MNKVVGSSQKDENENGLGGKKMKRMTCAILTLLLVSASVCIPVEALDASAQRQQDLVEIELNGDVFSVLVEEIEGIRSATLFEEVPEEKLPLAEIAVEMALNGETNVSAMQQMMTSVEVVTVTSANATYFGRHISEDPMQEDAHSTMQAYLDNVNVNTPGGHMSTYGEMSGAWYGGGNATKIELDNTVE